ncbi:glutathione S-transferase [Cognatishimia activa]|uniref:Glutaredoxin 2 n=1 Tax=Cognatishimia activa TaxID=1715691 RepID=A0A0P1J2K2_9RHOB|nr:glutathione S-transferase [Cognatishimia activa]CUI44714.1 glutaredoxin 2 [Cognatishimia activa]CUK24663.1 glutaredoxin 2 [Cognatishimia activa]
MTPLLYSFRRCPYAMRARLAIAASGQKVELREIVLRDKAPAFLQTSPSGTVPCLKVDDRVIDESLDIMVWALERSDPEGWLNMPDEGNDLIKEADGPFKKALDRTKYANRYKDADPEEERINANVFLQKLDAQLMQPFLFGPSPTLADMAILPFVRQFAFIDKARFDAEDWPSLSRWLEGFLASDRFKSIMQKYDKWVSGDAPIFLPE